MPLTSPEPVNLNSTGFWFGTNDEILTYLCEQNPGHVFVGFEWLDDDTVIPLRPGQRPTTEDPEMYWISK